MKKYYWILVDTLAKTLEIVESASCQAATEEQIAKSKFNIDKMNGLQRTQFSNRFRMIFNDTNDKKEGMGAFLEKRAANLTDF